MRALLVLATILGLVAGAAQAGSLDLDNCVDGSGRTVPGRLDTSLDVLVRAGSEEGRTVLRYNPDVLPDLSDQARQFFFAHACAQVALREPAAQPTPARARRADCLGVATLQASGLLRDAAAVEALQAELVFSAAEWTRLPGPPRSFDLAACPRQSGLRLPLATPPSAGQMEWNGCVRQCGDRLYHCRGENCQAAYERCEAACRR